MMRRISATAVTTEAFLTVAALFSLLAFRAPSMIFKPLQTGLAACYSRRSIGHRTTSGQRYDPNALTAAHGTIPMGTHIRITNLENGKSVVVVVNDRMTAHGKIIMDISERACKELHFGSSGEAKVKLELEPSKSATTSHS
jgi:rare lipoprotein A